MYTRLTGRRLPSMVLDTNNEWDISPDKSGVLIKGRLEGPYVVGLPISVTRHAVHLMVNPEIGNRNNIRVFSEDDGEFTPRFTLPKQLSREAVESLDWHFKLFIARVDLPNN